MAWEASQPLKHTFVAGEDLRTKQFYFVKLDTDGTVIAMTGAGQMPIGVLQNKPNDGEEAEVVILGITKVSGDADLAKAAYIMASADGQAAASTPTADDYVVGQCLDDNSAAGGLAVCVVNCAAAGQSN